MSTKELRREVLVLRRRRTSAAIVICVAVAATQVALLGWLLYPRERVRIVRETTTTTQVVTLPVAMPIDHEIYISTERTCPRPRHDAPRVRPAAVPERVTHLRPSPTNAGWIAAWSEEAIFLSDDAGGSWHRALDGEGQVRDVAFDCFGRAIAIRGRRLGIRDGDRDSWRTLPVFDVTDHRALEEPATVAVLGGGPDVALVGLEPIPDQLWRARLAISRDLGTTWETHSLDQEWEGGELRGRQYEDGSIRAMLPVPDCMGDSAWLFTYRDGVVHGDYDAVSPNMAFFGDAVLSDREWKHDGDHEMRPIVGLESVNPDIIEGPSPIVAVDGTLYRVTNGKASPLPYKLSDEATSLVADAAGRVWSIVCGQPTIATRADAPICDCDGP